MTASPLARLEAALVVSCQARPGDPMRDPRVSAALAQAVVSGGAGGVRIEGVDDVSAVRAVVDVPLIGLWKDGAEGVYITPTVAHARAVAAAGADVVAIDGTGRARPDGNSLADTIAALHADDIVVMADVSTVDEGLAAQAAGADLVASTLSGYTPTSPPPDGPDLALVAQLVRALDVPVVAEGRISTPEQAAAALDAGAFAVVVGTAITRPAVLTAQFVDALERVSAR